MATGMEMLMAAVIKNMPPEVQNKIGEMHAFAVALTAQLDRIEAVLMTNSARLSDIERELFHADRTGIDGTGSETPRLGTNGQTGFVGGETGER